MTTHPHPEPTRPQPMPVRFIYRGKTLIVDVLATDDTARAHQAIRRAFTGARIHPNQTIQAELFS